MKDIPEPPLPPLPLNASVDSISALSQRPPSAQLRRTRQTPDLSTAATGAFDGTDIPSPNRRERRTPPSSETLTSSAEHGDYIYRGGGAEKKGAGAEVLNGGDRGRQSSQRRIAYYESHFSERGEGGASQTAWGMAPVMVELSTNVIVG